MPKVTHRLSALCLATVLAASGFASVSPVETVAAVDAPWTTPTPPAKCTTAQMNSGNVAGCTVTLGSGLPESRGWPAPPYPDPAAGPVLPWVDLTIGSTGTTVAKVQEALVTGGATIPADGQFGALTAAAVKAFQTAHGLTATGIVNEATATALGVQNTAPSAVFPPTGWTWLGWGYNGSTALYQWEQLMVGNATRIGSIAPNQLHSFADALPLFEGFVAEIQSRGYTIGDAGMYVFRCTATTRKDCGSLTRSSLSNHAYGLALDINTAKNPLKSYSGVGGATACQTPMQTDIPQWVVQVAESWGLYWGGYGWSSGCSSPSQVKSSVSRDPMHFEFNGTVTQAKAIKAAHAAGATPTPPAAPTGNCFQVADTNGAVTTRCFAKTETPGANTRVVVTTDAPAGATSALVNITTAGATENGYITAEGCGAAPNVVRQWSNGNVRPNRAVASSAVVPLDELGRFCLYQSTAMHTIVDVQGFFSPATGQPTDSFYTPVAPQRSTDTRGRPICLPGAGCNGLGPIPAGTEIRNTAVAPPGTTATVANITAVGGSGTGYVTADACATLTPGPQTRSVVNFANGDTVANFVVTPSVDTPAGAEFCTYSPNGLHEIVDVQGYFAPHSPTSLAFTQQAPTRLMDTRGCWSDPITQVQRCAQRNAAGSIVRLLAPAGAQAVVVNLTAMDAQAPGYVTANACSSMAPGAQSQSNLNAILGSPVANMAIVPVGADGTFCVYMSSSMHLAVDVMGTFAAGNGTQYLPITPVRVHDSRLPG
ncbi:MAG: peptidoglycan-binding protein [Ilumatobacteraceae bacterium]